MYPGSLLHLPPGSCLRSCSSRSPHRHLVVVLCVHFSFFHSPPSYSWNLSKMLRCLVCFPICALPLFIFLPATFSRFCRLLAQAVLVYNWYLFSLHHDNGQSHTDIVYTLQFLCTRSLRAFRSSIVSVDFRS